MSGSDIPLDLLKRIINLENVCENELEEEMNEIRTELIVVLVKQQKYFFNGVVYKLGLGGARLLASAFMVGANISLTHLSLPDNAINDKALLVLVVALPNTLSHLDLSRNLISDTGVLFLCEKVPSSLVELRIKRNMFRITGACDIITVLLPRVNFLTALYLDDNEIGLDGVRALANVWPAKNTSLKKLGLGGLDASKKLYAITSRVQAWSHFFEKLCVSNIALTFLDLCNNTLEDAGARAFAFSISEKNLFKELDFSNNAISDDSFITMVESLPASSLYSLYLRDNRCGNGGAYALASFLQSPTTSLRTLQLENNCIGDALSVRPWRPTKF